MNATSETAKNEFLSFLGEKKNQFNEPMKGHYIETSEQAEKFCQCVSTLTNTYGFVRKELAEKILSDSVMAQNFEIIACHWVRACAEKYDRLNYYRDLRDKESAEMCANIVQDEEWVKTYLKTTKVDPADEYWTERTLGTYCVARCVNMHPTLRQTFTGLVLTFIMNDKGLEKLAEMLLEESIVPSRDVSFVMI